MKRKTSVTTKSESKSISSAVSISSSSQQTTNVEVRRELGFSNPSPQINKVVTHQTVTNITRQISTETQQKKTQKQAVTYTPLYKQNALDRWNISSPGNLSRTVLGINSNIEAVPSTSGLQISKNLTTPLNLFEGNSSVFNSSPPTSRTELTKLPPKNLRNVDGRPNEANTQFQISNPQFVNYKSAPADLEQMEKPMKIKVIKNGKVYDKNCKVPTYNTSGKNRGLALIINNINFINNAKENRSGAKVDEKNLTSLFKELKISPTVKRNLKRQEMLKALKDFAKNSQLSKVDLCFIVIMSHGYGNINGNTVVCGTDDEEVSVPTITDFFTDGNCPALKGKPKIFVFQACRGHNKIMETDVKEFSPNPLKDMLLAFATIPGFVAYRNPKEGSLYIQALCKVFMKHACDTHVDDMLVMVNVELDKTKDYRQVSSHENTGFKNCYLHPT